MRRPDGCPQAGPPDLRGCGLAPSRRDEARRGLAPFSDIEHLTDEQRAAWFRVDSTVASAHVCENCRDGKLSVMNTIPIGEIEDPPSL